MSIWAGRPARPARPGRPPKLSDAELLTLAVAQVLLGVRSETRWLRFVPAQPPGAFPYLPGQSGYNKRLRAAVPLIKKLIRMLANDTELWADPVWVVDSTPSRVRSFRPITAVTFGSPPEIATLAAMGRSPTRWACQTRNGTPSPEPGARHSCPQDPGSWRRRCSAGTNC